MGLMATVFLGRAVTFVQLDQLVTGMQHEMLEGLVGNDFVATEVTHPIN